MKTLKIEFLEATDNEVNAVWNWFERMAKDFGFPMSTPNGLDMKNVTEHYVRHVRQKRLTGYYEIGQDFYAQCPKCHTQLVRILRNKK